jgi:hypothetical protein
LAIKNICQASAEPCAIYSSAVRCDILYQEQNVRINELKVTILSRVKSLALALVLVLTASLSQAAPAAAAAAGAVSSAAARGGLFGDLLAFFSDLAEMLGSMFGGGSKGGHSGDHSGEGHSGWGAPQSKLPGNVPPVDWDNDWDGDGYKDSRDLWKKWYC